MPGPLQIRTEPPLAARGNRRRRPWMPSALALCCLTVAVMAFVAVRDRLRSAGSARSQVASQGRMGGPRSSAEASPHDVRRPKPDAAAREVAVDDPAGELLWLSPTAGPPISLAYVPDGAQCLIHVRPALVAAHPEGERITASLGPWGAAAIEQLQTISHARLADIEALLLSIVVTDDGRLDAVVRLELVNGSPAAGSFDRLQGREAREHNGFEYYLAAGRAYLALAGDVPGEASKTFFVVAPPPLAAELIDSAAKPPSLVRDIEALIARTDRRRAATIVLAPRFLQASGHGLLRAEASPLHSVLTWLLADEAAAVALSAHWSDSFFCELRAAPALNVSPYRLAAGVQQRIAAAPDAAGELLLAASWHPHGREVVARFPAMLQALARYSRRGEDHGQALVRCYLPAAAGHNLLMAGELWLTQPQTTVGALPDRPPAPFRSIDERLATASSLAFAKETLERALELMAEDVGVPIVIRGADLQQEGITKNQSFGIDLHERPAGEILVEILRRANPDRAAIGPADPRQKLVYVIQPGPSGDPGRIIITTRTAANKRGERIADAFLGNDR